MFVSRDVKWKRRSLMKEFSSGGKLSTSSNSHRTSALWTPFLFFLTVAHLPLLDPCAFGVMIHMWEILLSEGFTAVPFSRASFFFSSWSPSCTLFFLCQVILIMDICKMSHRFTNGRQRGAMACFCCLCMTWAAESRRIDALVADHDAQLLFMWWSVS